jgi:phosphatidylglycerophosphatase A
MDIRRLLTSCFGLGWLPVAPGTWGSLPPAIIFGLLCHLGLSTASAAVIMAVLALAGSVVCVKFAPAVIAATGKPDPREIVADEFAGQAITFLPTGLWAINEFPTTGIWIAVGFGFMLFRIFDITKPWPIRRLEKLPKGWGILADDLLAGVFAAIVLQIFPPVTSLIKQIH